MDEAPIPLLIALSVLLALAVGCIIYLITRIQALKQRVSEADIRQMVDMGEETGEIEKEERELIENVFEFNNSTAAEVMIHRTDVVMLWAEDPDEEIMKTIRDSGLTRFPVYEEDTDDIIGILNTREYLLNAQEETPKPLRELLREAQLRRVEEKLSQAVEEARKGAFPLEELHEMLDILYKGEEL